MGRVYKALVRADRAGIGERKIGRPDPERTPVPLRRSTTIAPVITRATAAQPPTLQEVSEKRAQATQLLSTQIIKLESNRVAELTVTHKPKLFEEPLEIRDIHELPHDPLLSIQIREDAGAIEQYESLAARLLSFTGQRKVKTVLITSAEAGEGKTNVAVGAAWAAAKLSRNRVLLLDANPDNPSVAGLLGINPTSGWSSLIDRSCEAKQAMLRIDPNGLYVLTPGRSAGGFDVMAASFQELIADVACHFELVIVDSPAILESACTQRLVETLDGTVVVARSASTHRDKVAAARKLIPKQRRLGVVLNQIEPGLVGKRGRRSMFGRLFGRR
jgi:Mrp family chromosome partitioning ATPase